MTVGFGVRVRGFRGASTDFDVSLLVNYADGAGSGGIICLLKVDRFSTDFVFFIINESFINLNRWFDTMNPIEHSLSVIIDNIHSQNDSNDEPLWNVDFLWKIKFRCR